MRVAIMRARSGGGGGGGRSGGGDEIVLATDDDREGEAIAYHVCQVFGLDVTTTPRIVFREITPVALKEALQNPGRIDMRIVRSQMARQVIDVLIGFKVSPLLWKAVGFSKSNPLSAGRCQTPALRFVYDEYSKSRLGDSSSSSDITSSYSYIVQATFFEQVPLVCTLSTRSLRTREEAEAFLARSRDFVHMGQLRFERTLTRRAPAGGFNTSGLLQAASSQLHYSPAQTMRVAQELYEQGLITYMRTENTKYSETFVDTMFAFLLQENLVTSPAQMGCKASLIAPPAAATTSKNPHEAIRVTDPNRRDASGRKSKKSLSLDPLYKLIWLRSVQSCMCDAVFDRHVVTVTSPDDRYFYEGHVDVPKQLGFLAVGSGSGSGSGSDEMSKTTTTTKKSQLLYYQTVLNSAATRGLVWSKIECVYANNDEDGETTAAVAAAEMLFTESSLIRRLEDWRIGRPSTYASFLSSLLDRKYVVKGDVPGTTVNCEDLVLKRSSSEMEVQVVPKQKTFGAKSNRLLIQPLGVLCMEFLAKHFHAVFSYEYSQTLEATLEDLDQFDHPRSWLDTALRCEEQLDACVRAVGRKIPKEGTFALRDVDEKEAVLVFFPDGNKAVYRPASTTTTNTAEQQQQYTVVKRDLDFEMVRRREYSLDDLLGPTDVCGSSSGGRPGRGDGHGDGGGDGDSPIVRQVSERMSVRKGPYGIYLYFKENLDNKVKPKFFKLKNVLVREQYMTYDETQMLEAVVVNKPSKPPFRKQWKRN